MNWTNVKITFEKNMGYMGYPKHQKHLFTGVKNFSYQFPRPCCSIASNKSISSSAVHPFTTKQKVPLSCNKEKAITAF